MSRMVRDNAPHILVLLQGESGCNSGDRNWGKATMCTKIRSAASWN